MGRVKPGRLAKEALKDTDLDEFDPDAAVPIAALETHRRVALGNVDRDETRRLRSSLEREEKLTRRLTELHRPRFDDRREQVTQESNTIREWRNLGLAERLKSFALPPVAKVAVVLFLTFIDFYVFARAVAVIQDVEAAPDNPEFWLGGVLGVFVSLVAFFLGRLIKEARVFPAQARLAGHLRHKNPDVELPAAAGPRGRDALGLGVVFALMLGLAALFRLEAEVEENIGFLIFQLLLPIVIVFIEYLVHDPLEMGRARRSFTHWRLERKLRKVTSRLRQAREDFRLLRANVTQMFSKERVTLLKLMQAKGVTVDADVNDRAAALLAEAMPAPLPTVVDVRVRATPEPEQSTHVVDDYEAAPVDGQ